MFDLLGSEMPLAARFFIAFLVVLVLIGVVAWLVRRFGASRLGGGNARGRQPRLAVIDAAPVDSRRRLVLIRRDNVEHLLMIGGPTDVVVEQNIVRGTPARTEPAVNATAAVAPPVIAPPAFAASPTPFAPPSRQPMQTESSWPLQPASEPAPVPAPRPYRAAATEEPWLPPEPGARPRPAPEALTGSLTGLAAELSTRLSATESTAPAVRVEPPARPAPPVTGPDMTAEPATAQTSDHNLAEMAQQLEAALRRSPSSEGARPPVTDPLAVPSVDPAGRPTGRDYKLRVDPKFEDQFGAKSDAGPQPESERKPEPRFENAPEPRVEPRIDSKPKTATGSGKSVYDSLEEEMASLLGRPPGKT